MVCAETARTHRAFGELPPVKEFDVDQIGDTILVKPERYIYKYWQMIAHVRQNSYWSARGGTNASKEAVYPQFSAAK